MTVPTRATSTSSRRQTFLSESGCHFARFQCRLIPMHAPLPLLRTTWMRSRFPGSSTRSTASGSTALESTWTRMVTDSPTPSRRYGILRTPSMLTRTETASRTAGKSKTGWTRTHLPTPTPTPTRTGSPISTSTTTGLCRTSPMRPT